MKRPASCSGLLAQVETRTQRIATWTFQNIFTPLNSFVGLL
jgi:hypothetical protein